jgi:LemA protein
MAATDSFFSRNKTWLIPVIILGAIALILALWFMGTYNGLVTARGNVDRQWANVEVQYQRRSDLVPNLVQTVAAFAAQERNVLTAVTDARSKVGSVQITVDDLSDPAKLQAFQAAQGELSGALSRLIAVAENYPELRSSENFLALQDQLEGTENRIAVARKDFNDAVFTYNVRTQRIPSAIIARMFGFEPRASFAADEGSEQAPDVAKEQFA